MSRRRVTLKDIAAELGLSHPTVSRALANHGRISQDTRLKVQEAASRLGYVANSGARLIRRGHSNVVGLLLPDITNEFYAAVAQRLADECSQRGLQLLLSISGNDADRERALVKALLESRPSGLIVTLTHHPHAETFGYLANTTCLQFMHSHAEVDGPVISVEDSAGARKAIQHLLELGHRRIGFVGPLGSTRLGSARLRGVSEALEGTSLGDSPVLYSLGPSTADFGSAAVAGLLDQADPPTAIYLSSGPLALGGMRTLSMRGVSVPQDLSVVVSGGSPWYEAWPGGLTAVSLPSARLADAAATRLFELLDGVPQLAPDSGPSAAFELYVRGSAAPPK